MKLTNELSRSVTERNPIRDNGNLFGKYELEGEFFRPEVLILHEDSATGMQAEYLLDDLQNQLDINICFLISVCRFGILEDPELAESVLQQAKQMDIVVPSLHGHQKLPIAVREWLLRWLDSRDFKPCALVASFDSCTGDSLKFNSTWKFLRAITTPLEVDLFLHLGEPSLLAGRRERSDLERDENNSPFCFNLGIIS